MLNFKALFKGCLLADVLIGGIIIYYVISLVWLSTNPIDGWFIFLIIVATLFAILTSWLQKKSQEYNVFDSWQQTKKIFSGPKAYK